MATSDPSQHVFETAKDAFREELNDDDLFADLLATTSIEQVWQVAQKVQAQQGVEKRMRHMGKMKGFLDKLIGYSGAVEVFVQAKPEILALIWGPIRFLIQWTSNLVMFADAVTKAMAAIGDALPHFAEMAQTFGSNERLKDVLALFYHDILDFYVIVLKFSRKSRVELVLKALWPRRLEKINCVVSSIERHVNSMRNEVTIQHIRSEHEFRVKSLAQCDQEADFQESQKFHALKTRISPRDFHDQLDRLLNRMSEGTARWLLKDKNFSKWLDISNSEVRLLWLCGIPGAGKTFLSAAAIEAAQAGKRVLFAFVSHVHYSSTTAKSVIESLLFQLASQVGDARSVLAQVNEEEHLSSTKKVSELLKTLFGTVGPMFIVLDGLDEMEAFERIMLLRHVVSWMDCPRIKILVGSRSEDDISKMLEPKATVIRVDKYNSGSIQSYVNQRAKKWMDDCDFEQDAQVQIQRFLVPIAAKANGMFLYARIVLDNVEPLTSIDQIESELRALPEDLNDAYHRIFARISEAPRKVQQQARTILGWIGCCPVPMTRQEMEQALLVHAGPVEAPKVVARVNFVHTCGPIIEVVNDTLQVVHFTVKEHMFSRETVCFVSNAEANCSLAKVALTYLCSEIFDEDISDEELRENILSGKYRLWLFAMNQWTALVRRCMEQSNDLSAYPDVLELLKRLTRELKNCKFNDPVTVQDSTYQRIGAAWPEISEAICGVLQFRRDERQDGWNLSVYSLRDWPGRRGRGTCLSP